MKFSINTCSAVIFSLLILGCSPSSDKLVPLEKHSHFKDTHDTYDPMVDILFVIDNSGSMGSHQTNLAKNIRLFIDKIKNVNFLKFQVGVTSTDVDSYGDEGKLLGSPIIVDQNTPNLENILYRNMLIGVNGSAEERPLDAAYMALSDPNTSFANKGFLRPDADLAIVFLTDAEDQSNIFVNSPQDLAIHLLSLKNGDESRIHIYGAFIPSGADEDTCSRDESYVAPVRIESFFKIMNGISFFLCDPNFGDKLAALADNLVSKIVKVIRLSRIPIPSTIHVTYGSQVIPNEPKVGWTFSPSQNAVILGDDVVLTQQPVGTKLDVSFTVAN